MNATGSREGPNGSGFSGGDGGVTPFGVMDAIGGDAADPPFNWGLRQQSG